MLSLLSTLEFKLFRSFLINVFPIINIVPGPWWHVVFFLIKSTISEEMSEGISRIA